MDLKEALSVVSRAERMQQSASSRAPLTKPSRLLEAALVMRRHIEDGGDTEFMQRVHGVTATFKPTIDAAVRGEPIPATDLKSCVELWEMLRAMPFDDQPALVKRAVRAMRRRIQKALVEVIQEELLDQDAG